MKACLYLNGEQQPYPEDIDDLEGLIVHVMEKKETVEDIIVNVNVDGAGFSEAYDHQARDIGLKTIRTVHVSTVSVEWFSSQFLSQTAAYIDHLKKGFKRSIRLLRENEKDDNGHAILASSLDTLRALKNHLANVRDVVEKAEQGTGIWHQFESIAELVGQAQEDMNPFLLANLLEEKVLPFLEEWKVAA